MVVLVAAGPLPNFLAVETSADIRAWKLGNVPNRDREASPFNS